MNGFCKTEADHTCQQISSIEELHMFILQESIADTLTCKTMMAVQGNTWLKSVLALELPRSGPQASLREE